MKLRRLTKKITTSQPHMLVEQVEISCTHGRMGRCDSLCCFVCFGTRLEDLTDVDHDCRTGSAHSPTSCLCPLNLVQRPLHDMGSRLSCQKRHSVVDANATVVVNIFTLEVAVEDISTEGEAKGLKTAHETLLDEAGWTRPCCFGGAVQKGKFRPVSGFLNGLRERYKAVIEPGYAGQLTAHGTLAADTASKESEAFKKFSKEKENREKAQIPEEAVRVALHLAASREHGLKKASFFMEPLLHAETLEYLCSFEGDMEDPSANQQMLQKVLAIKEQHFEEHHPELAFTLDNLAIAHAKLGDTGTQKELLDRALKIFQEHYGEEHYAVARTLVNLGIAYIDLEEYKKAKELFERALKIEVQHYAQDHVEVAMTIYNLALAHGDLGECEKAAEMMESVPLVYEDHFGAHDDRCTEVRRELDRASRLK